MEEIWKEIKGFDGKYEVSNLHSVRSWIDSHGNRRKVPKILKQCLNSRGYPQVCLCDNGKKKVKPVHQLVWEAFNGKVPNGFQINHINEIKTDNRLENLNLMTPKENINWGTRNERVAKAQINDKKKSKSVVQKTLQGRVVKIWPSAAEIERQLGYAQQNISSCCNENRKSAYGYLWKYYTEKATA